MDRLCLTFEFCCRELTTTRQLPKCLLPSRLACGMTYTPCLAPDRGRDGPNELPLPFSSLPPITHRRQNPLIHQDFSLYHHYDPSSSSHVRQRSASLSLLQLPRGLSLTSSPHRLVLTAQRDLPHRTLHHLCVPSRLGVLPDRFFEPRSVLAR
jgi:hypothetical protein